MQIHWWIPTALSDRRTEDLLATSGLAGNGGT